MTQSHASSSGNNNAPTPMELKDFVCTVDQRIIYCDRKKPIINNGIDLAMEGETVIDLAAVTHFTSGKRKLPTDFLDSLDVGEIKKVATSKFQSIIVIPITAYHGPNEKEASGTDALIDTGAIHNFVSLEWADYLGIPIEKFDLDQRRTYRLADGTEYVLCKAFCAITIRIDDTHHVENTTFHILESCSFHVILGMQWLKRHRPHLSFNDNYQKIIMNCLTTRCTPVNFDIESPVATTTTTASSPVVAEEATLSFPTTPVVEVLTPLVVANRPPTPHPSILDIEPFSETLLHHLCCK
ncbi:Retrotransposon-derived protein peg10 [Mucor circinelloides]